MERTQNIQTNMKLTLGIAEQYTHFNYQIILKYFFKFLNDG